MSNEEFFEFTKKMRDQAEKAGFTFEMRYHWLLTRKSDGAIIWPHIDAYISAFTRDGMYVKHKRFKDFEKALKRKFGDKNEDESVSSEIDSYH